MRLGRFSSVLVVLLLLIMAAFLAVAMSRPKPELDVDVAQVQGSPTPMATQSAIPPPTSIETRPPGVTPTVLPTLHPPLTSIIPGPTMNATEVAETEHVRYVSDILNFSPGTIIARSIGPTPTGTARPIITGYEIKEVVLTSTITTEIRVPTLHSRQMHVETVTFDRFWRLTVLGGPFMAGNNSWYIWIDDTIVNKGPSAVIFDRTLLREGARIGVSWGNSTLLLTYLDETLHIP